MNDVDPEAESRAWAAVQEDLATHESGEGIELNGAALLVSAETGSLAT
jgi:hypothetical protein